MLNLDHILILVVYIIILTNAYDFNRHFSCVNSIHVYTKPWNVTIDYVDFKQSQVWQDSMILQGKVIKSWREYKTDSRHVSEI